MIFTPPILKSLDWQAIGNLVAVDPAVRQKNIVFLQKCLELAPQFGTANVATETGTRHPGSDWNDSPDNRSVETWRLLEDAIGQLVETATRNGSILALEGYVNNVLARLDQVDALFRAFPSSRRALMLDPVQLHFARAVSVADMICEEFLRRYQERFVIAHLKDVAPLGAGSGD